MAERIYVCGGPGSGKTTLATLLAARTGLPLHHLDDIAREGGGRGPERSAEERATAVAAIVTAERWIVEGVHLGWPGPLLEAADTVVWLDHVAWRRSSGRIVRRFAAQAIAEARRRRGRERFLRLRDYARKLRELAVSVPEARTFDHAQLAAALAPHAHKVHRCTTEADVERALEELSG